MQDVEKVVKPFEDKMLAVLSPAQRGEFQKMHGKEINLRASILVPTIGQFAAARSAAAGDPAALRRSLALMQLEPGTPRIALRLLQKDVVAKDLALTDEQRKNIKEISDEFEKNKTQIGSGYSKEQVRKTRLLLNTAAEKMIDVLSEQQCKRLRQILIQASDGFTLTNSRIPGELQLSAEQSERKRQLQRQWLADDTAIGKETADKAEKRAKAKKLSQELRKNFEALLTPEQHRQFEAIQGKKIDIGDLYPTEPDKNSKPKDSGSAADGGIGTK
jgi:Spy/CpxP family protein refolding chaperone